MTEMPNTQPQPQQPGDARGAPPSRPAAPPRRPLPSPLAVITVALGAFLIVLTLLAIQVRNGRDPALGPGPVGSAGSGGSKSTAVKGSQVQQATKIVSQSSPVPP